MFGQIIKKYRLQMGLSQKELAKALHVSQQAVGSWEVERTNLSADMMEKLSCFFGITIDQLFGREEPVAIPPRKGVRIPVYGNVAAGIPIEAISDFDADDPDSWEEITQEMAAKGEYFALRIKGDSMSPQICDGDVVIVRHQEDVESGETAIVMVNGDDATCKRVIKQEQGINLVANNPVYETRFFTNEDIINIPVRVLGKVVELRRSF